MRIATFNIQHGTGVDGGAADLDELVEACRGLDADVLALQEVDRGVPRSGRVDQAAELAEALGATYTFGASQKLDGGEYGNALLVRGELDRVRVVALERHFRSEPRCAVLADATIDGVRCGVAVTHLTVDNHLAHEQFVQVIDLMASAPVPRMILGDLNLQPVEVLPTTTAEGYQLVRTAPTYPNRSPQAQIDHVAVTGLEVHDVEVVATPISDHRAVVVSVEPSTT